MESIAILVPEKNHGCAKQQSKEIGLLHENETAHCMDAELIKKYL